jgi:hypothetical protein
MVELDPKHAKETMSKINEVQWLDPKTRFVCFEFLVYRCV